MKIINGFLKGQTIYFKPNPFLRPTADKVRKSIFDRLQGGVEGKAVLDLYSGTGALGFEALSLGADFVAFVEKSKAQCAMIYQSLKKLKLENAKVVCRDALDFLSKNKKQDQLYDLVFLDPPYDQQFAKKTLEALVKSPWLKSGAIVVAETRFSEKLEKQYETLTLKDDREYGDSRIWVYRNDQT